MDQHLRHQCLIYSGAASEQIPAICTILIEKLKSGYRCLYMNSPAMISELKSHLTAAGINISQQIKRGALVLSSDKEHLIDGHFQVDSMLSMLKSAAQDSQADGYLGLWASGDISWEFGTKRNLKKLLEYECKLEQLLQDTPALHGVCQYHMDTLPAEIIQNALHTHKAVFINQTLSKLNPHYLPPKVLLSERPSISDSVFERMLEGLGIAPYPVKTEESFE